MTVTQQLTSVRERLAQLDPNNRDHLGEISNLKTQEVELMRQVELEQEKYERMTTALTETAAAVDSMDIDGISLRELIPDEQAYQFVKIAFQSMLNAKDAKYIDELATVQTERKEEQRAFAEREANLVFQMREKDKLLAQNETKFNELEGRLNTVEFERDEALKVRDNAAAEIEGYKLALAEKDEHINKLRTEIAVGAKGAVQIDHTEQLRQAKEAFLNSRIKVTNIRWADEIKQREYMAELASTGETITFNRLEKGKYLEVSQEEASRFRAEQAQSAAEAAPTVEDTVPSTPLVTGEITPPELPFREEVGPVEGLDTSAAGEVAQPTLEEAFRRIEALEKAVFVVGRPL